MLRTAETGLTTGAAAFIEDARHAGRIYIEQPYELYSSENHLAWQRLYRRMLPKWDRFANEHFLQGLSALDLPPDHIPRLEDVNRRLKPLSGFEARAVAGYVPAFLFFDCLRNRCFPTTITIRPHDRLDYLPEPDIFHDICGHVPMHTDPAFARTLARLGECAHTAAALVSNLPDGRGRLGVLRSILRAMARFFWFSIEFGLMRSRGGLRVYGSGLLSSHAEIEHAATAPGVERLPFDLARVIHEPFEIDRFQPRLFIVDSFEHLYHLVDQLEAWMLAGRLNHAAPGEPEIREEDLRSFLEAAPVS
jgi:phenylalanine-4-hydroxylase